MPVRVAINGFGRIGRNILRAILESGRTDIDDWCIGSHTGGMPARYETDLSGFYDDKQSDARGSSSHSCTWNIHLDAPER